MILTDAIHFNRSVVGVCACNRVYRRLWLGVVILIVEHIFEGRSLDFEFGFGFDLDCGGGVRDCVRDASKKEREEEKGY